MKIGIDCRTMLDPQNERGGGIERYTFTLVTELVKNTHHSFVLFLSKEYQSDGLFLDLENVTVHYVASGDIPFWSRHFGFSRQVNKYNLDIFHSPTTSLPLGLHSKATVTVHDLAIYTHPEWFPAGQWFSRHILVPYALNKAKKIVAVSEVSKKDCMELFNVEEEKIAVVYNALPDKKMFFKIPATVRKLPKRYILFIGTIEPRKNLERIFHVFLGLKKKAAFKNLSLVIVGSDGWRIEDVFSEYSRSELVKKGVYFLKNVTEIEKWNIIDKAELLFFPSLYEGFGLPVLEAFTANKRVITSRKGALEEVGGTDAIYVDPYDVPEMITMLEKELQKEDVLFHPDTQKFSRTRLYKKMFSIFEEVY
jgi:glycosyltransferase involved in cell wall biosynthesis